MLVVNVSDKLYTLHFVTFIIIVSIISGMFLVIVGVFDNRHSSTFSISLYA